MTPRSLTRDAIVDAFLDLSHDANTVSISMPAVAEKAGVSVRTLYRYFATKDDLQTEAANYFNDRVRQRFTSEIHINNFTDYLTSLWSDFATETPAVIAEHATPIGRELRIKRLGPARETVRRAVGSEVGDDTVDMLVALTSSSMFLELVDRMGHSPRKAVEMVAKTVMQLVAASPNPTARIPEESHRHDR